MIHHQKGKNLIFMMGYVRMRKYSQLKLSVVGMQNRCIQQPMPFKTLFRGLSKLHLFSYGQLPTSIKLD